jgi:hypothetical protein
VKDIMRHERGAPKILDRATFQAESDALRVREKAHPRADDAIAAAPGGCPRTEMISNMTVSIDRDVTPGQERLKASPDHWLSLAATPTFAFMAALTAILGGGGHEMLCSAATPMSPLSGMIPMYLLMSAFHSAPWLKLVSRRRSDACRS